VKIKPLETRYNGYRFRSRLEARWAVFFNSLDINYKYEPEGYCIGSNVWYLPDFYLPDLDYWLEIKPMPNISLEDIEKTGLFSDKVHKIFVICGDPYLDSYNVCVPRKNNDTSYSLDKTTIKWGICPNCNRVGLLTDMGEIGAGHLEYDTPDCSLYPAEYKESKCCYYYDDIDNFSDNAIQCENCSTYGGYYSKEHIYQSVRLKYSLDEWNKVGSNGRYCENADAVFPLNEYAPFKNQALMCAYLNARSARFEHGENPIIKSNSCDDEYFSGDEFNEEWNRVMGREERHDRYIDEKLKNYSWVNKPDGIPDEMFCIIMDEACSYEWWEGDVNESIKDEWWGKIIDANRENKAFYGENSFL